VGRYHILRILKLKDGAIWPRPQNDFVAEPDLPHRPSGFLPTTLFLWLREVRRLSFMPSTDRDKCQLLRY
jgi:hypothetical protein